jgi:hypothetical protein
MRIHINKNKKISNVSPNKSWTNINVFYELNSEERNILNTNILIMDMVLLEQQFYLPGGIASVVKIKHTVKQLTNERYTQTSVGDEGCLLGCFPTNAEICEVEEKVNAGANILKAKLKSVNSIETGAIMKGLVNVEC